MRLQLPFYGSSAAASNPHPAHAYVVTLWIYAVKRDCTYGRHTVNYVHLNIHAYFTKCITRIPRSLCDVLCMCSARHLLCVKPSIMYSCQYCAHLNRVDTSTHIVDRLDRFYDPQRNCVKPEEYSVGHSAFSNALILERAVC